MYETKKKYFYGTGRRKSSVARVRVYENGTGSIIINGRDINDYFGLDTLKLIVNQPLVSTEMVGKVDIVVTVAGGGVSGQAGAIRHGLSRALLTLNPEYRATLKAAGFLTRDPRMKERKKYGLKAARRAPQFSKRYLQPYGNYQKTPIPSRFSGFSFCLKICLGANLVQIILKGYDTRNVIALLLYPIPSKYVTAQTT